MQKTVIAIVSYNSKRYMQECINSIRNKIAPGSYLISVVDNASTDGIAQWLAAQPDILLTQNSENVGFGPACNQAVKATVGTEFETADVFLLNNDTVMTSTALPRMINTLYSADDIGAVGAMGNYAGNRQQIDLDFPSTEDYVNFGEGLQIPAADSRLEKVRLNGFAMLVRRNVWDTIGGFDEDFAPGYYEDDALSIDILKLGYRLVLSRDSFIYHVGSASFVKTGKNNLSIEHHELFIKKYGFDILDYVYPCGAVMAQITYGRSDSFRVLHLGCGLGAEMKAIRSLYPNAEVFGIEPNHILYDISSKTEKIYRDIATANEAIGQGRINLLIVDSNLLSSLTDIDKLHLIKMCAQDALEIGRLHDYDDYPFDDIKMILWKNDLYSPTISKHLENWGIMSSTYGNEDVNTRINAFGLPMKNVLVLDNGSIVPYLTAHFSRLPATDPSHKKAAMLSAFEKRTEAGRNYISKDIFCNVLGLTVSVCTDCESKLDEIVALLSDCSLLDYVKKDYNRARLSRMMADEWNDCAYITAKDTFADYGIVGFYCFNTRQNEMLSFAFSWVVNDLGIEQYIYNRLGCPAFDIALPVLHPLMKGAETPWIQCIESTSATGRSGGSIRILLKGDKSLHSIEDYLVGGKITCEYDDLATLSTASPASQVTALLPTKLYTEPFHIVIFSLMQYNYDAWEADSDSLLSGLLGTLDSLCNGTPGNPTIILLLGSEAPFSAGTDRDKKLAELHSELRPIIDEYAADHPKIRTINITDHIREQSDFDGSINAFGVRVYSDIVEQIVVYINEKVDEIIASRQGNNTGKP